MQIPPNPEQLKIVEAFLKALSIPFGTKGEAEAPNPAFVSKMERSHKEMQEGKYKTIKTKYLWKYSTLGKVISVPKPFNKP